MTKELLYHRVHLPQPVFLSDEEIGMEKSSTGLWNFLPGGEGSWVWCWLVLPVTTGLQFEAGLYNGNPFSNKKDKTWFSFENRHLSHPCHPFHRMGMLSLIKAVRVVEGAGLSAV